MLHGSLLSALGPTTAPLHVASPSHLELRITAADVRGVAPVVADATPQINAGATSPPPEIAAARPPSGLNGAAATLELPVDEVFYKSSELDEQPYPLLRVLPVYPPHARAHGLEGSVRLLLLIDESGKLRHLEVVDAVPLGQFDEAAVAAFRGVHFSPGRRGGAAVKSRMLIKVDFTLEKLESVPRE